MRRGGHRDFIGFLGVVEVQIELLRMDVAQTLARFAKDQRLNRLFHVPTGVQIFFDRLQVLDAKLDVKLYLHLEAVKLRLEGVLGLQQEWLRQVSFF